MKWALKLLVAAGLLIVPATGRSAEAGERRIVLREHVNRRWNNELLSFSFTAPEGACHPDSVRCQGPDGPMAVQLSNVETWPGTDTVKSAILWLVGDLAPRATNSYTVHYGAKAQPSGGAVGDFQLHAGRDEVEMTTSGFGARLRLGEETYDPARAAADVPGPLLALRLADGTWFGGSRFFGNTKLTGWSGSVAAEGPVFGQVDYVYRYADGNIVRLTARLAAGAAGLDWESQVTQDRPEEGVDIVLSRSLPPLTLMIQREAYGDRPQVEDAQWGAWVEIPLETYSDSRVTQLSPWADWWSTWTQTCVRLRIGDGPRELHLASRDPGAWVEPAPAGTIRDWSAWQHKLLPVQRGPDGEILLRVNNAAGERKWTIEDRPPAYAEQRRMSLAQVKAEWPPLDEVKDWVLDWPAQSRTPPHLFVSREEVEATWQNREADPDAERTADYLAREEIRPVPSYKDAQAIEAYLMTGGDPGIAAKVRLVDRVRQHMGVLGDWDKMRHTQQVTALYDLMMGTELVSDADKHLFRSQMAFLGYILAGPSTWDIERGYRSYNPNMSLSYLLARGIVGCAIPDHPRAAEWVAPGLQRAELWLDEVGPEGEWYESAHYSQVSAFAMTSFAVAVKRAGFRNLFTHEQLNKWAMWLAQIYTPPDPMEGRGHRRGSPPIGRATAGVPWGLFGLMSKATAESDPAYSRKMQWAWAGTDYTTNTANHLGGFEKIYMDRTLPVQVPDWHSTLFPEMGPLLRNGVGEEHENYLVIHANRPGGAARSSELGCLPLWFARGVPVAGSFPGGYKERHQLLISRVIPAISWHEGEPWNEAHFGCNTSVTIGTFSALPRQDFFTASYRYDGWDGGPYGQPGDLVSWPPVEKQAEFPMTWHRRLLYVQADQSDGPNYLMLRDSVRGGKPSLWQMWTVSQRLGTPEQAGDLESFLADASGKTAVAAHRLPQQARYTAIGQFGVDLEYFIASPQDTERWTMRFGHKYVDYSVAGEDYRDLLQLRLGGDGDYVVVMFPRFRQENAPEFESLSGGNVVKVAGDFGTDYCFLPADETKVAAEEAQFSGQAGSVQDRGESLVLATAAAGHVRYGAWSLTAPQAASLRVEKDRLAVQLQCDHQQGGDVTLRTEDSWKLKPDQPGVTSTAVDGGYRLTLVPGVTSAVLER